MGKIYIGANTDTEQGRGKVVDVFQKGDDLFAEVRLDSDGSRIFIGIERSQFPDECDEHEAEIRLRDI